MDDFLELYYKKLDQMLERRHLIDCEKSFSESFDHVNNLEALEICVYQIWYSRLLKGYIIPTFSHIFPSWAENSVTTAHVNTAQSSSL